LSKYFNEALEIYFWYFDFGPRDDNIIAVFQLPDGKLHIIACDVG
jgi:hypothetical protein